MHFWADTCIIRKYDQSHIEIFERNLLRDKMAKKITTSLRMTLLLLYLGYFLDFYDLSIFAISYNEIIKSQFHIFSPFEIQKMRMILTNYQIAGILIGSVIFGFFGDKIGRTFSIRYSILLYSIATLASVFTTSLPLFTFFRFISGVGLAAEFSTSNVLIAEIVKKEEQCRSAGILYFFGICGGLCALIFGLISWKFMFLFGGISGFLLFLFREMMLESSLFLKMKQTQSHFKSSFSKSLFHRENLLKVALLGILILPFNFIITVFFLLPKYMQIHFTPEVTSKLTMLTFYIGNIFGTLLSVYFIKKFKTYKAYLLLNIPLFIIILAVHRQITDFTFIPFGICLGILGGGYPIIWIQFALRFFSTNIRNTTSNFLFAMGRGWSILFNMIFIHWIANGHAFSVKSIWAAIFISILCFGILMGIKDNYNKDLAF